MKHLKNKFVIALILMIIGLSLDGLLFVKLNVLYLRKEEVKVKERILKTEKNALDELQKSIKAKEKSLEIVQRMFPKTNDDFSVYMNQLSATATATGQIIKMTSDPKPREKSKDKFSYYIEGIQINLDGDYPNLLRFLKSFNELPIYGQIDSTSIDKHTDDSGVATVLKTTLYMRTYDK